MGSEQNYLRMSLPSGEQIDITPDNAALYTHAGGPEIAQYDHVYITTGERDGELVGGYFFRFTEVFEALRRHFIDNGYPLHLNMIRVPEGDKAAFEHYLTQDADDILGGNPGVPTEWTDEPK